MPSLPRPVVRAIPYVMLFVAAVVIGAELARPFGSASIGFDSQVSVLHFDRLISGRRLEAFVSTTPKPLLTVIYGPLYEITHDWRALAWAAIGAYGLAVALAARLAHRLSGPIAGAFVGIAVLGSPGLLFDVGFALATPWALLGWVGAGLALSGGRPRYGLAGVLLALATLARLETLVLVGAAAAAMAWARFGPVSGAFPRPPRRAWLVPALGVLAIPALMLHDLLLTGDPFFWATVASRYSALTKLAILTPGEVVIFLVDRYWAAGAVTILAALGGVRLILDRRWGLVVGLVALGPGIAAFLVLLAARGIFVSERYATGVDLAIAFAAGIGFAGLSHEVLDRIRLDGSPWKGQQRVPRAIWVIAPIAAAALIATIVVRPYWVADPTLRPTIRDSLTLARNTERVRPILATALATVQRSEGSGGQSLIIAPTAVRPRLVVDLGLLLPQIAGTDASKINVAGGYPGPGQLVFHDRAADRPAPGWADLETSVPHTVGAITVEPLLADPERGVWVLRLR